MFVSTPPKSAVTNAAIGRKIANGSPSSEYVARIESTPVAGVEMRKLTLAPLLAPSFRRAIDVGITPQLQIGSGTPNRAAHSTDMKFDLEILGTYRWFGTHTCKMPASKKPSSRNGAISENSVINSCTKTLKISTKESMSTFPSCGECA